MVTFSLRRSLVFYLIGCDFFIDGLLEDLEFFLFQGNHGSLGIGILEESGVVDSFEEVVFVMVDGESGMWFVVIEVLQFLGCAARAVVRESWECVVLVYWFDKHMVGMVLAISFKVFVSDEGL
jgi:hypothetical protein